MKGLNHLVLAARNLDALSDAWTDLGFTLTPRAQHPFGTGNAVIQLRGCYLELLAVTEPAKVVEHAAGRFSFSAFNRDYLARHEGFSMLALDTANAGADIDAWRTAGLETYEPFEFARMGRMGDGREVRLGFSLAYLTTPAAPWLGHFACQHFHPEYYEQPHFLTHPNTARSVRDVWITGEGALDLAGHMAVFAGGAGVADGTGRVVFETPTGAIILAGPAAFEAAFGAPPPHPADGPHLAGLTIACERLDLPESLGLARVGRRLVLPPERGFGTAVAFCA